MPIYLRQSTASQEIPLGYFVDSTNGNDEETALSIANTDIKVWKTGATTLANKNSGGATHISNGLYYAVLDATDTDTIGPLVIFCHVTGALSVRVECVVLDETVYDVMFGTTAPATATNITAGTITTATNLTNLPAITSNWLTAAGIAASALDGKGNWNVGKTGYSLTATTGLGNQTSNITGNLSGSVGSVTGAVGSVTGAVGSVTGNVGGNVVGSVASVTAGVTVTTNNDKTGYALSAAGVDAIWDEPTAGHTTVSTMGRDLVIAGGTLVETTATGTPTTTTIQLTAGSTIDDFYNDQLIYIASGTGAGQVRPILDYTGATKTVTVDEAFVTTPVSGDAVIVQTTHVHPLAQIADKVWDELLSGHAVSGSTGEALSAAGTAGDPWTTALPGAYGAGTAGNIIGNRIVGTLATGTHNPQSGDAYARLGAPAGVSVSADVAAVKADTTATLLDTGTDGVVVAAGSKTGYTLTAVTGLGAQTADISGSVSSVTGAVGSVTGAVGSVTGAVGSVTGNVGGNVVGSVASVTARVTANSDQIAGVATAATRLARSTQGIVTGTVGAASSTTSIVTSALDPAAAVIDQYKGRIVTFDQGTTTANLRGQSTDITSNTALGVLTVTALTTAPVSGDTFTIT